MPTVKLSEEVNKATMSRLAKENPDLPREFIVTLFQAQQEALAGKLEPYSFGPVGSIYPGQ